MPSERGKVKGKVNAVSPHPYFLFCKAVLGGIVRDG